MRVEISQTKIFCVTIASKYKWRQRTRPSREITNEISLAFRNSNTIFNWNSIAPRDRRTYQYNYNRRLVSNNQGQDEIEIIKCGIRILKSRWEYVLNYGGHLFAHIHIQHIYIYTYIHITVDLNNKSVPTLGLTP